MHVARVAALERLWDKEDEAEARRWLLGHWVASRAEYHARIADREVPRTRAEQKADEKKNHDAAIRKAQRWREEHDGEWHEALSSPAHFGKFVGMPEVFGAPPERRVKTADEIKAERERKIQTGMAAARRALASLG